LRTCNAISFFAEGAQRYKRHARVILNWRVLRTPCF